ISRTRTTATTVNLTGYPSRRSSRSNQNTAATKKSSKKLPKCGSWGGVFWTFQLTNDDMKATIYIPPLSILLALGMLCGLTSFRSMESTDEDSSSLHWNVLPSSSIAIKGSSNVNTFGCDASGTFNAQPLVGILAK